MSQVVIRVYGILINEEKQVLVSDEKIRGQFFTKFPGGGLEFGEGTRQCLCREFQEEMNLSVSVGDHVYTTDYFQLSAFNTTHQIVSIYYLVNPLEPIRIPLRQIPFDFDDSALALYETTKQIETFRFIPWNEFSSDLLSLPIDKIVAGIVKDRY